MTRKHLRPATPAEKKGRRKAVPAHDIPLDEAVPFILSEGRIGNEHHASIKNWLIALRNDYETDLKRLGSYASDKQIDDGLTKILKRAAQLKKALLENKAVAYALREHHMISGKERLPSSRDVESEQYATTHENDIDGVSRIHDLASNTLEARSKDRPDRFSKCTAAKPELSNLSSAMLRFWTEQLDRADPDKVGGDFLNFCRAVHGHIVGPRGDEALTVSLRNAIERQQARRKMEIEAGVKEK